MNKFIEKNTAKFPYPPCNICILKLPARSKKNFSSLIRLSLISPIIERLLYKRKKRRGKKLENLIDFWNSTSKISIGKTKGIEKEKCRFQVQALQSTLIKQKKRKRIPVEIHFHFAKKRKRKNVTSFHRNEAFHNRVHKTRARRSK